MDGWNTSFLLGWPIFRCYVSFREGNVNFFETREVHSLGIQSPCRKVFVCSMKPFSVSLSQDPRKRRNLGNSQPPTPNIHLQMLPWKHQRTSKMDRNHKQIYNYDQSSHVRKVIVILVEWFLLNLPYDFEGSGVLNRSSFSRKIHEHPWQPWSLLQYRKVFAPWSHPLI